jgi:FHS family L-fucose permease-like MFS transporter
VAIGSILINYLMQPHVLNVAEDIAGPMIALYWGGAMVGRFIGSALLRVISPGLILGSVAIGAVVLIAVSANSTGQVAAYSLLAVGLMNSIMFPTIFSLACEKLGPRAADGSGIINVAICGGAIVPLAFGALADLTGGNLSLALALPVVCYVVIAGFGIYARRPA